MDEALLRQLLKQNPWWDGKMPQVPKTRRFLFGDVKESMGRRQITAVVGPRRVGKTTIMKQLISELSPPENICYISFDDIRFQEYGSAFQLLDYFLSNSDDSRIRYLFLDEIQKLGNWADFLKTAYDTEEKLKIVVSGSASLGITQHRETLAGRLLSFELHTMGFSEFLAFRGEEMGEYPRAVMKKERYERLFEEYLMRGGFPEIVGETDQKFVEKYIRESLVEKAIRDVSELTDRDERKVGELFLLLASYNGQLFSLDTLAKDLGISRITASRYLDLLEKAFLVRVLYNYSGGVPSRVRKRKKVYLASSSMVMSVLSYPREVLLTEASGRLAETAAVGQLGAELFWRSPQKKEVDIVLVGEKIVPIEVKYRSRIGKGDLAGIAAFCKRFGLEEGVILTKSLKGELEYRGIRVHAIPVWYFLGSRTQSCCA